MCRVQTTFADLQVDAFCFDLVWFESRLYAVRDRRSLVSDVLMLACPAACPAAFPPSFLLGSIVCDVFCSLFHCVQQLASRVRINGLCSGFAWRQLKLVFEACGVCWTAYSCTQTVFQWRRWSTFGPSWGCSRCFFLLLNDDTLSVFLRLLASSF